MSTGYEVVDVGHVGGHEQGPSEWKTIRAVFHDFASLPSERGAMTFSPVLECHGLKWKVLIYPGGHPASNGDEACVSLFLVSESCSSTKKIKAQTIMRIPSAGTYTVAILIGPRTLQGTLTPKSLKVGDSRIMHGDLTSLIRRKTTLWVAISPSKSTFKSC